MVGLLLLLGLFWYWASTLIGDDDNNPDTTPTVAIVIDSTETATSTATETTNIQPTETTGQPNATATEGTSEETPTEEATESNGEPVSTAFELDDTVVTNDSVNLRTDPTADSEAITTLPADTELTITGGPEADADVDGRIWWEVTDPDGNDGWVVEEAIDPAT